MVKNGKRNKVGQLLSSFFPFRNEILDDYVAKYSLDNQPGTTNVPTE